MKHIFTLIFISISALLYSQSPKPIDTVVFCYNNYKVPAECKAVSETELQCDNYSVEWFYMNEDLIETMPDQFVYEQSTNWGKKYEKQAIKCYILNTEVKGYKVSFKGEKKMVYKIIAFGTANEQPVLVQLTMNKNPETNKDLPEFVTQFLKLTKEPAEKK